MRATRCAGIEFFEAAELSQELIDQTRGKLSHLGEQFRMNLRFICKTEDDEKT